MFRLKRPSYLYRELADMNFVYGPVNGNGRQSFNLCWLVHLTTKVTFYRLSETIRASLASHSTAWRFLKEQSLYRYHFFALWLFTTEDIFRRIIAQSADHLFFSSALFTDEATFCRNGITKLQKLTFVSGSKG